MIIDPMWFWIFFSECLCEQEVADLKKAAREKRDDALMQTYRFVELLLWKLQHYSHMVSEG